MTIGISSIVFTNEGQKKNTRSNTVISLVDNLLEDRGTLVSRWTADQLKRSCTRDMIRSKIHLINPGCPRPNILTRAKSWPKTLCSHFISPGRNDNIL